MLFEFPDGATPLTDYSDLLLPWVHNMNDLNRVEAENISHAQKKYLRATRQDVSSWFTYQELQSIHRSMFGKVWTWAGKQRKSVTSIGVDPRFISMRIAELCEEVSSWSKEPTELTFLEKSARIHHRLVLIHLFENGNGRFSRLVADRCLLSWKCPYPIWPTNLQRDGIIRKHYIESLKAADKSDYQPLIDLMKKFGARDPNLGTLFHDHFYLPYIQNSKGLAIIKALLRNGTDPNQKTESGHSSLQLIIKSKIGHFNKLEFIKLLVGNGAKVDLVDKSGLTPLQTADRIEEKEIAHYLLSKGANSGSMR